MVTDQTGLRAPLDVIAGELSDLAFKELTSGTEMTVALAGSVTSILEKYPTRNSEFRENLHIIAERNFSWATVARGYLDLGK